jgi:hypothetical protein
VFQLYRQAAAAGDVDALYLEGNCHFEGVSTTKDGENAAELFHQAADAGCAAARSSLGRCYESGTYVVKDMGKAVALY